MTFLLIPARNDIPWYKFKITLSGTIYTLRFRYNVRMQRWIMDISDASDQDIVNGLPLILLRNLNGRFALATLPPGTFFITDDTNQGTQPTRYSFGTTHTLFYADPTQ